jgi:hypothetical protein
MQMRRHSRMIAQLILRLPGVLALQSCALKGRVRPSA